MEFSILMSIYYKEKSEYLQRAMISIWDEQTVKPNEIVLVLDGPLSVELYNIIDVWKEKLGVVLKIISLKQNVGLGKALNEGMKNCTYEIIARMDTDDISLFNRFEKQLKIFEEEIDICSSWISEFDLNESNIISYRKLPELHDDIINYSKLRNPINHPAVMYRKSIVEKSGGYKQMMWFEDYYLWIRMIINGAKFYNVQEPLVNMRAGYGQLERRGGFKYALEEWKFLKKLKEIGFLNSYQFIKNVIIRFTARILPKIILKTIYKKIRD